MTNHARRNFPKRILYAWEIGDSFGHLQNLALAAEAIGGRSVFALPAGKGEAYLRRRGFTEFETFDVPAPVAPNGYVAASFADVLNVYAYGDAVRLSALVESVSAILARVQPDCVVAECAPTFAMLSDKCIAIGTSWGLPVAGKPMPRYPWTTHEPLVDEAVLSEIVREVIPHRRDIKCLADWFDCPTIPLCYPGMDAWGSRGAGSARSCEKSDPGGGVFAYLSPEYPAIDALLDALPDDAHVHVKGVDGPFDLDDEMRRCSLVVHHGSSGIAHAALSAGRAQALFPYHVENMLNAYRLMDLGVATATGHAQPETFGAMLALPDSVRATHVAAVADAIVDYPGIRAVVEAVERFDAT